MNFYLRTRHSLQAVELERIPWRLLLSENTTISFEDLPDNRTRMSFLCLRPCDFRENPVYFTTRGHLSSTSTPREGDASKNRQISPREVVESAERVKRDQYPQNFCGRTEWPILGVIIRKWIIGFLRNPFIHSNTVVRFSTIFLPQ